MIENEQQQQGAPPPQVDPNAEVLAKISALENELRETKEEAAYWRQHQAAQAAVAEEEAEPAEIAISEDLADAVGSNDAKRVMGAIRQMGFVDERTVLKMIDSATTRVQTESQVYEQYPDLRDQKSEMFKRTAAEYKELTQGLSKAVIKENSARYIAKAAKLAALELGVEVEAPAPRTRTAERNDDDHEAQRLSRVRSQQTSRGSRERADDGADDELSPQQAQLVATLKRIGAPIDEESYRKAAKKGVSLSGMGMQQPRKAA